jgi:hypothetical protein
MTTSSKKAGGGDKTGNIGTPAAEDRTAQRRGSLAALAVNVPAITRAAIGSRGFAEAGLITHWPEIIGAELARGCQPDMLRFPKGERHDGTLTLRCIGAMALEIQHQSPFLLDRINGYFGYRAVARLRLVQGTLRRRPSRSPAKLPALAPAERAATEANLAALPDGEVKDALRRLGEAIRQRAKVPRRNP